MSRKVIINGRIITASEILEGFDLWLNDDRIAEIVPRGMLPHELAIEVLDACNGYVTPGLIDLHSDYIEHMAAPRPTSLMNFELSLRESEKELIGHGITMMYHSLSMWKTGEFDYKPIREPENVRQFVELIHASHVSKHLVRHRFHARFEIDNVDEIETLKQFIREGKVHLVSFMDHTPGQGQYRSLEMYRSTLKKYNGRLSEHDIDGIIATQQSREKLTLETMSDVAALAADYQISIASHDDDSVEKLELVRGFGTTISEFPITMEVARRARSMGIHTMAGAPNVLLGGSHSGNLSAAEAIKNGAIDMLCSDYYPAGLVHAVFTLHEKYGLDLAEMFKLVTLHPAQAVGIDEDFGSIEPGKKADVLIIEQLESSFPVITSVFVDGQLIQKTNYRR